MDNVKHSFSPDKVGQTESVTQKVCVDAAVLIFQSCNALTIKPLKQAE